jgi:hypothetical protein
MPQCLIGKGNDQGINKSQRDHEAECRLVWYHTDKVVEVVLDGVFLSQSPKPGWHDIDVAFMGF